MTFRKLGIACGVGIFFAMGCNSVLAMGLVNTAAPLASAEAPETVSFFGRPYPYGYTGWGPCVRYVEVETRWGLRLRRVWVCR